MRKMKMMLASLLVACMLLPMVPAITAKAAADVTKDGITVSGITSTSAIVNWTEAYNNSRILGHNVTSVSATLWSVNYGTQTLCTRQQIYGGTMNNMLHAGTYYMIEVYMYYMYDDATEAYDFYTVDFTTDGSTNTNINPQQPTNTTQAPTLTVAVPKVDKATIQKSTLYANASGYDGYTKNLEWRVLDVKNGNKVVKTDTSYSSATTMYSMARKIYAVQCRAVAYDANYNKVYSNWSAKKYVVSQPKTTTKKSNIKYHSVKISFKKIKGASSYTIYMRKHKTKKWTKVKTIKKNSMTLTKFKGNTMNLESPSYDVCIVTNAKVGGKKIKSSKYEGTHYYVYRY